MSVSVVVYDALVNRTVAVAVRNIAVVTVDVTSICVGAGVGVDIVVSVAVAVGVGVGVGIGIGDFAAAVGSIFIVLSVVVTFPAGAAVITKQTVTAITGTNTVCSLLETSCTFPATFAAYTVFAV